MVLCCGLTVWVEEERRSMRKREEMAAGEEGEASERAQSR